MLLDGDDGSEEWDDEDDTEWENRPKDADRFGLDLWTGSYGDERERERGSEREAGLFYGFRPPQETTSQALLDFDVENFTDNEALHLAEVPPERCLFGQAMFYGRVTDCAWMDEDYMSSELWRQRDKLDIFIGKDMHDLGGPWRMFLVIRTNFGSQIEEVERAEGQ